MFKGEQREEILKLLHEKHCLFGYPTSIDEDELDKTIEYFVDYNLDISCEFLRNFHINPFENERLTKLLIDKCYFAYLINEDKKLMDQPSSKRLYALFNKCL